MATTDYDMITIGGGLGGAALAKAMAEQGARVLVLESDIHFKDRIRGEVMMSWGVADAKALGIFECMKAAGALRSSTVSNLRMVAARPGGIIRRPQFTKRPG